MKKSTPIIFLVALLFMGCQKNLDLLDSDYQSYSKTQLNDFIFKKIIDNGAFKWDDFSDDQLISAYTLSDDKRITVGWDLETGTEEDMKSIINFIYESEGKSMDKDLIIPIVNNNLNYLIADIENPATLIGLRHMPQTVATEPHYEMHTEEEVYDAIVRAEQERVDRVAKSGTIGKTGGTPKNASVIANHNVADAWNKSISGKGIKIAIIDSGVLSGDPYFGTSNNYNNPAPGSYQRSVDRVSYRREWYKRKLFWGFWTWDWRYESNVWSNASDINLIRSHGTDMMKNAGGPPVPNTKGVAFDANLMSVRSANVFWLIGLKDWLSVSYAFEELAKNSSVKVISMSQGSLLPRYPITAGIKNCVKNNRKLVFTAAGTFPLGQLISPIVSQLINNDPSGISLFPSTLPEVQGVTGITKLGPLQVYCFQCFGKGKFVVEFAGLDGSSSAATSSTAGMAALIWSKYPWMSASQVLNQMIKASERPNNSSSNFGHGKVDLRKFVRNNGL